ncbi:hypothetical protein [Burkholderia gladioli]|uniref:hypothetical protein n=1 Tax=Burkholderia gladioli TaxID=28095 RepID=UPI0011D1981A|nr:hypothetical protein [Burkholderia gladioli]MBW5280687.1 hypothetical protein [Burkholderia gladioli]
MAASIASIVEAQARQSGDRPIDAGATHDLATGSEVGPLQSVMEAAEAVAQADRALADAGSADPGELAAGDVSFEGDVDAAVRRAEQATAAALAAASGADDPQ